MELFNRAKAVRLKSHLQKYLAADDDELTVRQDRNGSSRKARWTVEFVQGNPHLIRLKSCYGGYLTASDAPFLFTGKKVLLTIPEFINKDPSVEWEPIKDGYKVKLRTKGGNFLRANGTTPPWRNSVTHDVPHRTATQDWVLWEVDMVDICVSDFENLQSESLSSSFSSFSDDFSESNVGSAPGTPLASSETSISSRGKPWSSISSNNGSLVTASRRKQDGMQFFDKAKAVRLQSHLGKYLVADEDEETVRQSRNGSSRKARWTVEFVEGKSDVIRLKSCHGLYLAASEEAFLLGATGKKILQALPAKMTDTRTHWEPVREGFHVKLRTSEGKFLRANWGPPPWRNSVTHDIPHRTATQDWVLWGVDIVDIILSDTESLSSCLSSASSFSSMQDYYSPSPETGSPMAYGSSRKSGSDVSQEDNPNGSPKQVHQSPSFISIVSFDLEEP